MCLMHVCISVWSVFRRDSQAYNVNPLRCHLLCTRAAMLSIQNIQRDRESGGQSAPSSYVTTHSQGRGWLWWVELGVPAAPWEAGAEERGERPEEGTDFSPDAKYSISLPGLALQEYRKQCKEKEGRGT